MNCPPLPPLPSPPKPLPQVPGPKLAPFTPTAYADIEFVEVLSDPEDNMHSYICEVRLNKEPRPYVLKMFYFFHPKYLEEISLVRTLASPQLYVDYFDPFSCECRAYGRLKDENREDLAIRAHGYLLLTPEQEAQVMKLYRYEPEDSEGELDGDNFWGRWEMHRHLPVRAIVKDLAPEADAFTPEHLCTMWEDMEDLHRLGILVRDIGLANYSEGKLLDFSCSWTTPHPSLMYTTPTFLRQERQSDPHDLYMLIIEYAASWRWDWDKIDFPEGLRQCEEGTGSGEGYGVDPRKYDWLKWEEDPSAAMEALAPENLFLPRPSDDGR